MGLDLGAECITITISITRLFLTRSITSARPRHSHCGVSCYTSPHQHVALIDALVIGAIQTTSGLTSKRRLALSCALRSEKPCGHV